MKIDAVVRTGSLGCAFRRDAAMLFLLRHHGRAAGSTVNKEVMRLKHLLNRAVAWGYLKDSPARAVKRSKEAPGRARYLTTEERDKLLNGTDVAVKANDGRNLDSAPGARPHTPALHPRGAPNWRPAR